MAAPPPPPPSPRAPWLPTLLVGAVCVAMMGGALLLDPLSAPLGSAYTEAPGHLWGLWTTARGLFEWGPLVRVAPVGYPGLFASHLMDPINLILFLPFYFLFGEGAEGAIAGWNALHLGAVALGALGCYRLGRRLLGDAPYAPWAIAAMTAVFCASPYLLYVPYMGRTEYLPATLYPLHLALLHRWLRRPVGGAPGIAEAPPLWVGLACGLVLGAAALGGWYLAVFLALCEVPLSLGLAWHLPRKEAVIRLAQVAAVSLVCVLPALWSVTAFPPDSGSMMGASVIPISAAEFPFDALPGLFRVHQQQLGERWMDQTAYVGLIALLLGGLGAWARPKEAGLWLGLTFWLLLLAPGPFLVMDPMTVSAGSNADLPTLPGYYLLHLLPPLKAIRNWSRIAVVASLPAAVCALYGLNTVLGALRPRRVSLWGAGAVALVLVDQGTYPNTWSWFRPSFEVHAPAGLMAALAKLPAGAVLQMPIDVSLKQGGGPEERGNYLLWQLQHGRPISATPLGGYDSTLVTCALSRYAVHSEVLAVENRGGSLNPEAAVLQPVPPLRPDQVLCSQLSVPGLVQQGFSVITLHQDRAGASELDELLKAVLGEPDVAEGAVLAWDITDYAVPAAAQKVQSLCSLPMLPERFQSRVEAMANSVSGQATPGR